MTKIVLLPPVLPIRGLRGTDAQGSGAFGASRTKAGVGYGHKGVDFKSAVGDLVIAPATGTISHVGIAYPDSQLGSIHLDIEDADAECKLLYCYSTFAPGQRVAAGQVIGVAQDVSGYHAAKGHAGMTNHIHLELTVAGQLVDPLDFMETPV